MRRDVKAFSPRAVVSLILTELLGTQTDCLSLLDFSLHQFMTLKKHIYLKEKRNLLFFLLENLCTFYSANLKLQC